MALSVISRFCLIKAAMLLFLCCLLAFPSAALSGAKNGLLLWFNQVLPSLLPFLILSTLFLSTGLSDSIARKTAPILSPIFRCSPSGCYAVVVGLYAGKSNEHFWVLLFFPILYLIGYRFFFDGYARYFTVVYLGLSFAAYGITKD